MPGKKKGLSLEIVVVPEEIGASDLLLQKWNKTFYPRRRVDNRSFETYLFRFWLLWLLYMSKSSQDDLWVNNEPCIHAQILCNEYRG
jgi:hypothetical protein